MAQKLTGLKTTDSFAGKNTEDSLDLKIVLDEILSLKKEVVIETRSLSRQSVNIICGALKDRLGEVYGAVLFLQDTTLQSAFEKEMNTVYDRLEEKSRELEQKNITLLESQAKLLQSEKMAAVGQLASGVAHEINNPLGIILGFAQSVVKRLKDADPLTMPLKTIEREAMRCKNLVQDLLIFSRASGSAPRDDIDLNETVETTLPLLLVQTKMSGIKFIKEPGTGIPRIQANKAQLQQVLINLAGNAIDAMPDGGTLTVTTSLSRKLPNHVELRVQDTGSGIPKDIQKNIFEPFFTTKEIGKGTGLGLSLIYEIVRKHGGTIEVESEEGKGAVFTIALPVRPAARRSTGNSDA
jgi:signal transduction histidine kinase